MSRSRSTERLAAGPGRRRVVLLLLAVLAPAALGACGKKGTLRLPRPDELEEDPEPDLEGPA